MALIWPLEQQGSTGEDVKSVQYLLTAHGHSTGVDGVFGPATKSAVEAFQSSRGVPADGIVGPQTWPQLIVQVQQGSNGDAVRAVQSQIHGRGDGGQSPSTVPLARTPMTQYVRSRRCSDCRSTGSSDSRLGTIWSMAISQRQTRRRPPRTYSTPGRPTTATRPQERHPSRRERDLPESFSSSEGWSFEGCQGALGHTFCSWKRANGHELRIGVINAVEGPYYVADQAEFT